MKAKSDILGTEKIPKLLLKMSAPAVVGMLVMTLYNIVDSIFIGHKVGALGLGAVGVVFPLIMLVVALSMGFGIGASSIISRKLGEKDKEHAQKVFGNFLSALLLISFLFSLFGVLFIDKLIYLLGSSDSIFPYAKQYLLPLLFGLSFQIISASLTNIVRSVGSAKTAMISMILGSLTNLVLDYLFLFVFNFGIAGAAYATVISQLLSSLFLIFYFLKKNSELRLQLLPFNIPILKSIFIIGFPSFIRQSSMSVAGIIINHILLRLGGDMALSAYTIAFRIMMVLVLPAMGIMQGSQPIIGYNYGAKKLDRVKHTLMLSIISSTAIVFISFLFIFFFPELCINLFTKDSELISFTSHALTLIILSSPLIGFQFMVQGYFQAIGKAKEALILSMMRQVICLIPLLFIFPILFGLNGVWIAYPVSDIISSTVTAILLRKELQIM
ncbi:MAG: MATE family efflux transporter [Candidatus Woesearchaeota archaeon]|nr:MATE family efflux transporter [Nanoarchaeota archaeon]USN43696.1 MAG: MATE family efflux transporter [Candidatus Woesearchaeota archaeon]